MGVDFNRGLYDRKASLEADDEAFIEEEWDRRTRCNGTLFNGRKFRLSAVTLSESVCTLHVGVTDYKAYVGTHTSDRLFARENKALALGNVIITLTKDGAVPLLVRSAASADAAGKVSFPGGHPEPDDGCDGEAMRRGAVAEVCEELFVKEEDVGRLRFLGVVERLPDGKASLVYTATLGAMTRAQLAQAYTAGNVRRAESSGLVFEADAGLVGAAGRRRRGEYAAEALGAAEVWRGMRAMARRQGAAVSVAGCQS